jgi:hypothetical protein
MAARRIRITFPCQNTDYNRGMADLDDEEGENEDENEGEENDEAEEDEELEDDEDMDDEDLEEANVVVTVEQGAGKPVLVADIALNAAEMDIEGVRVLPSGTPVDPTSLRNLDLYHGPDVRPLR